MAEASSHPAANGVPAHVLERRAAVRHPCRVLSACHPVPEGDRLCGARAVDISATGIALVVDRPVEPETLLAVELPGRDQATPHTLLVEVRHCRPQPEGGWLLGCAFDHALSDADLRALL